MLSTFTLLIPWIANWITIQTSTNKCTIIYCLFDF